MKIAVFGASGNVGMHVLHALAQEVPAHEVLAISRDTEALKQKLGGSVPPGVELVKGDVLDKGSLDSILPGVERVFFCMPQPLTGAEMITASKTFADCCKSAGVACVVRLSSLNCDGFETKGGARMGQGPLGDAHVQGEAYMRELGLKVTSVRPTSFSSNFEKYDLASVTEHSKFSSPLGHEASVNWISNSDIGAVSAKALTTPSLDGKSVDITGPPCNTLSAEQMRSLLSRKTGREVSYAEVPMPPFPDFKGLWEFLRAGGFDVSTGVVREVLGREPQTFEEYLDGVLPK